jgi:glycosyltransferase involved in cell wall biosynthesis
VSAVSGELKGKKILLVSHSFAFGGAEKQICLLARFLADSGARVQIVLLKDAPNPYPDLLSEDTVISSIGYVPGHAGIFTRIARYLSGLKNLRVQVKEFAPDVVIPYLTMPNVVTLLCCLGLRRRVIVCERVYPHPSLSDRWTKLSVVTYFLASKVVVQTKQHLECLSGLYGKRVIRIPNFIQRRDVRLPKWEDREKVIISAGRLEKQKGFDLLIAAFDHAMAGHPEWKLKIIGEGTQREALKGMISARSLGDRVEIMGTTDAIFSEFLRAQVYVLSSRFEGFPNVLTEALAAGLAVIAADCLSGPSEVIEDAISGLLVESESEPALTAALVKIVQEDDLRQVLSEGATQRYQALIAENAAEVGWKKLLMAGKLDTAHQ